MTLLENVYQHLQYNGLVNNREHFSTQYLCRSKHWYAVQTHAGRDFSAAAAIQCLRSIRSTATRSLSAPQALALTTAERLVVWHLSQRHAVAEICMNMIVR